MTDPTRREQLLFTAAQSFPDESAVFTGFHWPIAASRVARRLHAPNLTSIFEAGITHRGLSEHVATSTTEVNTFDGHVDMYGDSLDTLHTFLKSGRLDGAVIDVSNVDRFGNVNSSVIGDVDDPAVRLPGPGGAHDIARYASPLTLVCGSSDPDRYQDRVSYVSAPGHLDGDDSRAAAGYPAGTGPTALLTPLGRFTFPDGEATLSALAPGVGVAEVREVTGWRVPDGDYDRLSPPDEDELAVVRQVFDEVAARGYTAIRP